MKKVILFAIILSITILETTAQTWQVVGILGFTPPVTQYSSTSLVLDHNGTPYVAFSDASNSGKVTVMKYNGVLWVVVGNADFSAGQGYDMSIAIDYNNLPYVAYGDEGNGSRATVTRFNGANWVNVGAAGFSEGVVNNCTIKFDSSYTPYVAYVDAYYSGKAVVEKFNGSAWVDVGTPGFTAGGTGQMTMALSAGGLPYVGYQDQANGFAESVMMYNGNNWVHVGASTFSNGTVQYTHITFNNSGTSPYVCYNAGYGTFSPNVQMFNGANWQYVGGQNLNNDQDYQNNIVIGENNTPYVVFPDGSYSSRATVMKYNGGWAAVGNTGFSTGEIWFPNIVVDAYNNIYVQYYDDGDSDKVSVMKFGNSGPSPLIANFTAGDSAICQNSTVSFTDQSAGSPLNWQWTFSGGTPQSSSAPNPVITYDTAGIYNVKLVVSNAGRVDSITKTSYIKVLALPATGLISANPGTVCSGDSVELFANGSSGALHWQSSATGSNFMDILGAYGSSYTISSLTQATNYRLIAANGICADTSSSLAVAVDSLPTPPALSINDSAICPYDSALIQAIGSFSSYQWNNGDTGSYIYAQNTGNYWLTVTNANGCTATSNHQGILVYPVVNPPLISATDSVFCPSDSTELLVTGNYASYIWSNGDTLSYTYVNVPDDYQLTVTDVNGCSAVSQRLNVSVYPLPSVSIEARGDTLTSTGASAYQWLLNDTNLTGATLPVYVALLSGNYAVQVTDSNGCQAVSSPDYVTVAGLGGTSESNEINIYPNPFTSSIFINTGTGFAFINWIKIYDLPGQVVLYEEIDDIPQGIIKLPMENLTSGVYFIKVSSNKSVYLAKIIKQ